MGASFSYRYQFMETAPYQYPVWVYNLTDTNIQYPLCHRFLPIIYRYDSENSANFTKTDIDIPLNGIDTNIDSWRLLHTDTDIFISYRYQV